jgi:hypothetical protein
MEPAGLEPATSWVRFRRAGLPNFASLQGRYAHRRAAQAAWIAADIRGMVVVSGTLGEECPNVFLAGERPGFVAAGGGRHDVEDDVARQLGVVAGLSRRPLRSEDFRGPTPDADYLRAIHGS